MTELPLKRTPSLGYNNLSYSQPLSKFVYIHKGEVHIANAGTKECSSLQLKNVFQVRVCGDLAIAAASNGANFFDLNKEKPLFTVPFAEDASKDSFLSRGIATLTEGGKTQVLIGQSSGAISVIEVSGENGTYVKTISENKDGIIDIASGKLGGSEVFVSADMSGDVLVFDAASFSVKTKLPKIDGDTCTSVVVMPELIGCGYGSGHIRLFAPNGEKVVEIAAHCKWIQAIAYDSANNLLASVAEDQQLLVFNMPTAANKKVSLKGQKLLKDCLLTGVQFTGDGKVATVAYDNERLVISEV